MMTLLRMSLQAGALIVGVLLIRALGRNRLPKKSFLLLWDVALIRLLVPLSFPASWNVLALLGEWWRHAGKTSADAPAGERIFQEAFRIAPLERLIASNTTMLPTFVTPVWLAGAVGFGVAFGVSIFKEYQELRFSLPVTEAASVTAWQAKHDLYRPLRVLLSDRVTTPLAVGIFHPRIILPKTVDLNNTKSVSYILTHEYFHLRRFDMLRKGVVLCAVCIHWFNPLVWVMALALDRDLEMTCDEAVLRYFGAGTAQKKEYAYSLLEIAEARSRYSPTRSYFGANFAEERIVSILKYKRASRLSVVAAAALFLCFAGALAVFGCESTVQTEPAGPYSTELLAADGTVIASSIHDAVNENYTDIWIDGTAFYSETVRCVNGAAGPHEEANAHLATYTNDGGTWPLEAGQTVRFALDVAPAEKAEDGWSVYIGYVKEGRYTILSNPRIYVGATTWHITVPEDGAYNFFLLNVSAGKISMDRVEIDIA